MIDNTHYCHFWCICSNRIDCIGTEQQNILTNCKFSTEQDFKKKPRGFSQEYGTKFDSVYVPPVILKYNSNYAAISTFVDELASHKCDLIGRKREQVEITCPAIVSVCNSHMGNVDLLNIIQGEFTLR